MKKLGFAAFLYGLYSGSIAIAAIGYALYELSSPVPLLAFLTSGNRQGAR